MCVWLQGKLYLKKGTVVDVHQPTVCDVVVDDPSQRVSGVRPPHPENFLWPVKASGV